MALTGLQIQKLLPKTNCKECGSNTCLAFAMKLAAKKAELSLCPYASDEAKQVLGAASEPPVKGLAFGSQGKLALGEETVLYRHEKKFVNQTALAININDTDDEAAVTKTLENIRDYVLERVGEILTIDMVSVSQKQKEVEPFVSLVKKAHAITGKPIVIRCQNCKAMEQSAEALSGTKSVLVCQAKNNCQSLCEVAKKHSHSLVVSADTMDGLSKKTAEFKEQKFNDLLISLPSDTLTERFQMQSIARTAALRDSVKPLGYPHFYAIEGDDLIENTVDAITEITKYGGICVLPTFDPAQLSALMTLRQNIYTDPQKPIQVEPKIYPVGEPKESSPVFVTTNFSLTYFIVSGEIENSGTSAWLVVPECEGMSVLTAWAAGKFNGASIASFIKKETSLESEVTTREIIIPGYVAQISGELEEELTGWKVSVGPQEAGDLESFVKAKGYA